MPTIIQEFPLGAFVVEATFLGETPVFALGNGLVRRVNGSAAEPTPVHNGAVLEATVTADGRLLPAATTAWSRSPLPTAR